MSTKREPLLSVEKLVDEFTEVHPYHAQIYAKQSACWVRDFYEAARAKDAKLIQRLVDALHIATRYNHYKTFPEEWHNSIKIWNRAMEDADAAGYKPSEP